MELIRIGEGKLKVMLTEEDMALYALDDTASDCSGTETRRAVFAILDAAKAQIGFDAARDRVCIQMFRGRAGGCELFVSCTEKGGRALPPALRLPERVPAGVGLPRARRAGLRGCIRRLPRRRRQAVSLAGNAAGASAPRSA